MAFLINVEVFFNSWEWSSSEVLTFRTTCKSHNLENRYRSFLARYLKEHWDTIQNCKPGTEGFNFVLLDAVETSDIEISSLIGQHRRAVNMIEAEFDREKARKAAEIEGDRIRSWILQNKDAVRRLIA